MTVDRHFVVFTHGGSSPDPLSVVVSCVGPPIGFGLDVTKDHVLNWDGQARYLRGVGWGVCK